MELKAKTRLGAGRNSAVGAISYDVREVVGGFKAFLKTKLPKLVKDLEPLQRAAEDEDGRGVLDALDKVHGPKESLAELKAAIDEVESVFPDLRKAVHSE